MDDLKLYSHKEKELDPLVQTIHIFNKDIGMEFWYIKVCNVSDTERKDCEISWYLREGESYKYLGILEAGRF